MKPPLQLILLAVFSAWLSGCSQEKQPYTFETVATGLESPWSLTFLPDGSALVTEVRGRLRRISPDGELGEPVENVPAVFFAGQGGLFDVVLHPEFSSNQLIYLSFAEGLDASNATTIARGRLNGNRLDDVEVIFRNLPRKDTRGHFGGRMAFLPDGTLLLTTGEGVRYRQAAQDIHSGLGKVLRMNDDGSAPADNPFPESPYVYSYGHRNPQGLAVSADGVVWLHEHGPKGGDEVNRIQPGHNYGWPAVTFGIDYNGEIISPHTSLPGMTLPAHYWVPSIAPSGLAIYAGGMFPQWSGDLFVGGLKSHDVRRLDVENGRVIGEEILFSELGVRIRDVRAGPDGAIYLLTNGKPGQLIRVIPQKRLQAGNP